MRASSAKRRCGIRASSRRSVTREHPRQARTLRETNTGDQPRSPSATRRVFTHCASFALPLVFAFIPCCCPLAATARTLLFSFFSLFLFSLAVFFSSAHPSPPPPPFSPSQTLHLTVHFDADSRPVDVPQKRNLKQDSFPPLGGALTVATSDFTQYSLNEFQAVMKTTIAAAPADAKVAVDEKAKSWLAATPLKEYALLQHAPAPHLCACLSPHPHLVLHTLPCCSLANSSASHAASTPRRSPPKCKSFPLRRRPFSTPT